MADYYSILKKTIASLPESNGSARRSVYSRARNAIVSQLKAYEPPLSPSEITAEQLRLEEAIRKVEAEAAREALGLGPSTTIAPEPSPQEAPAEPELEKSSEPEAPAPAVTANDVPEVASEPTLSADLDSPLTGGPSHSPLKSEIEAAEQLGSASHEAVQSAREAYEEAPEPVEEKADTSKERKEPTLGNVASREDDSTGNGDDEASSLFADEEPVAPSATSEVVSKAEARERRRAGREKRSASAALSKNGGRSSNVMPIALAAVLAVVIAGVSYFVLVPQDNGASLQETAQETGTDTGTEKIEAPTPAQQAAVEPEASETEEASNKNTDRLLDDNGEPAAAPDARSVTTTLITPGQTETVLVEPQPSATPLPSLPEDGAPADGQASGTDVASTSPTETPPAPSTAATADAQRSILYEEGEDGSGSGSASQGAVVWSLEDETDLSGKAQKVLVADVTIPERDVNVNLRIKPNDDTSLPASHLVEIKYEFPENYSAGDVVNVPGLVMKPTEEARGDALLGASVKVSPGYFWIALSSLTSERDRNLGLLRERGWIDIPMLYDNGKRGILTLEKGGVGSQAVDQAISSWTAG